MGYCGACQGTDTTWREVAPTGTVHSWTVTRQQLHPAFPVPYTLVLVDLDELPGVRLVGHLDGVPELAPGLACRARFESPAPGVTLVQWDVAPTASAAEPR